MATTKPLRRFAAIDAFAALAQHLNSNNDTIGVALLLKATKDMTDTLAWAVMLQPKIRKQAGGGR